MTSTRIRVHISEVAAKAIIDQADYYASQQDEALAARWEKAVAGSIRSLLRMPERGSLCHFHPAGLRRLRRISVSGFPQHLVFYRYIHEQRIVHIVHVLHGARDIEALLSPQLTP